MSNVMPVFEMLTLTNEESTVKEGAPSTSRSVKRDETLKNRKRHIKKSSHYSERKDTDESKKSAAIVEDEDDSNSEVEISKHEQSSSEDFDCNEDGVMRDIKTRAIFIRSIIRSATTKRGEKKKSDRVYNCYQHCNWCSKTVSNFAQHVRRTHKKKKAVREIEEQENVSERKRLIAL